MSDKQDQPQPPAPRAHPAGPQQSLTSYMTQHDLDGGVSLAIEGGGSTAPALLPDDGRRYDEGSLIARGGMGAVLRTRDRSIRRAVAMKVMLDPATATRQQLLRFIEEAQVTGQLEHPGIVPVHDLGVDEQDNLFYTMKLVRGTTLSEILARLADGDPDALARYPLNALLNILQRVSDAVAFAHSRGVIHRDLKPQNIMVGDFGEVLVMDWGLAKIQGQAPGAPGERAEALTTNGDTAAGPAIDSARADSGDAVRTLDGQIMGTPAFMSPEQAAGCVGSLDARADVYSLGAILYTILTLRPPVEGRTAREILAKVSSGEITAPTAIGRLVVTPSGVSGAKAEAATTNLFPHCPNGRIPASLSAVAMKALALDPAGRYASVTELQAEIEAYQTGFATTAEQAGLRRQLVLLLHRHRTFTLAVASVVLALAVGMTLATIQWQRATQAETTANRERDAAESARTAEARLRRKAEYDAYVGRIAQVQPMIAHRNYAVATAALAACPDEYRGWEWQRLQFLCQHGLAPFSGTRTVCFLPDGKTLASAAAAPGDGAVLLIDAQTGKLLRRLEGHRAEVVSVSASRQGRLLSAGRDGRAILWDAASGKPLRHLDTEDGAVGQMVALSADGSRVAVLTSKGLWIWAADGTAAAVRVEPPPGCAFLNCLAFAPDAASLAFGGSVLQKAATVWIVDAQTGGITAALEPPSYACMGIAVSPDGRLLLTLGYDGQVTLFDLQTRQTVNSYTAPDKACLMGAVFSPDGSHFAFGTGSMAVTLCETRTASVVRVFEGHSQWVTGLSFSPDGQLLATADVGGQGIVWATTGEPAKTRTIQVPRISCGRFLPGTHRLLLATGPGLRRVDTDTGSITELRQPGAAVDSSHLALTRDGGRVSLFDTADTLRVVSTADWELLAQWRTDTNQPRFMAFSPADDLLVTTGKAVGTAVKVWRTDGTLVRSWPTARNGPAAIFTPDGRQVVTAAVEQNALTWLDLDSGAVVASIPCTAPGFIGAVYSPDGRRVAVSDQGHVTVLDASTRQPLCVLEGHVGGVWTTEFSPDGRRVVTGGTDGSVRVWDAATGRPYLVFEDYPTVVVLATFSADGKTLATAANQDDRLIIRSVE